MPSASRLLCAVSVGAKCRAASRVVDHAVHLFGKRLRKVAGAQSGFHMAHRHVLVEGRQRAGERGGGIALHEQHVRLLGLDYRLERRQDARGDLGERLPGLHQVQVVIGRDFEGGQHLIEHGAVLCGDADAHLETVRFAAGSTAPGRA